MSKDMDDAIRRAAGHGMRRPEEREEEPQAPAPGSFGGGVRPRAPAPPKDGSTEFRAMYRAMRRRRATGPDDYWPEDAA